MTPKQPRSGASRPSTKKSPAVHKPAAHAAHEIRIIGGQWKRTKLKVLDKPGLRPTPDRVRETLFNWLGQDLTGWKVLDAFAGTGALGFEAASRGAKDATLVEQDSALVAQLQKLKAQLQAEALRVQRGDGVAAIAQAAPGSLHLILLDPPFDADLFGPSLRHCARALAADGWVYLEAPRAWSEDELAALGLRLHRHLKAGMVHAHLLAPLGTTA
ncbi:16S rRNA (guanine(966)-N(2))-methyltransferase RsmD [Curvibacter sp. APW13]|uniref:16S rRNA (guanine(966)-N(2))-methyltransferase RsmD n=1 Tax=Curvibacter sp. APW13 TaxID=3077236 RepID=UPI0028DFE12B|nr:16S rRNA (guanine(966)-N(2))-methyltransferase RsmD [Curvibacter sp. APW13]MDT8992472.1 16S rRNA (guanine(966)-N(2))-methyltransferase RsmD [Curvibacter sp. APW13]